MYNTSRELENEINFFDDEYQGEHVRPETLNLKDYNLNSALTKDVNKKVTAYSDKRIRSTGNRKLDHFIDQVGKSILPWDRNHYFLYELLSLKESCNTDLLDKLMHDTHQDANETIELVNVYLRHFNLPQKPRHNKVIVNRYVKFWGEVFVESVLLTLFMNNHNNEHVRKILNKIEVKTSSRRAKQYNLPAFGKFHISEFGIICEDHFLCKNFILMVKDIVSARFFSYLSVIDRIDTCFDLNDSEQLVNIWLEGDKLLGLIGNQCYDAIKLIEALANDDLIESAQEIRPEIDLKSDFHEFIQQQVEQFTRQGITFPKYIQSTLKANKNLEFKLSVYGMFRMWGHPYIDFEEGLSKLHEQVTMKKTIVDSLAQALASDLAYKVLEKKFAEFKKWFVDKETVDKNDPLYPYIMSDTWPPARVLADYGDKFHLLPLTACFEIPDFIDPTLIYSDKAHSLPKDELLQDIRNNASGPVKTMRVLDTLIKTDFTYWKVFLKEIDEKGLEDKWLVIGLKAKERELKIIGRYFALLSWKLREYFVITEYLIKIHFIKLYDGLTMADDLKGVVSKIINRTNHQGTHDYESITIANHIDYSKWNNHQRKESNKYLFKVMGQFMGYPNLFSRTHEFFEKSLIYYTGDRSLFRVSGGELINTTEVRACWNGQAGGLEGLRQKGWSLLNIVLLERIARKRNTKIRLLAQGDNQVICTSFKLSTTHDLYRKRHIEEIIIQNKKIMEDIKEGTQRLGLIINQEETMVSTEYLNYGKVPVYRGNICGLKIKRWARVNCFSNDNLPNLSNVISTVASTALSVSHFSISPVEPICNYNFFGCMMKRLMEIFDPCINGPIKFTKSRLISCIRTLYLDPSIGGVCGMNLNRFMIRNFPDPITESLSFWKIIYENTKNPIIKQIACDAGNPKIVEGTKNDFRSLIEDPTSLNIPRGLSPLTMLRNEIRANMINNLYQIKNEIIKDITKLGDSEEGTLLSFIMSITPIFPRFLSQIKASTSCGIKDSIVGMYENSRTIRKVFLDFMRTDFDEKVIQSELSAIQKLEYLGNVSHMGWSCSSNQADRLRRRSWGNEIVGMTIPHPSELFDVPGNKFSCKCLDDNDSEYLTTITEFEGDNLFESRGHLSPYLGSKTSEGTSILTPWEKESKIPFLKRVMKIKNAIHWFVHPHSNLAKSICNIIKSITGQDLEVGGEERKRTGSAIHRFSTERQSSGGYNAVSPTSLTRMFTTTDTLGSINTINYDFMYQSAIIFMQSILSRPNGYIVVGKHVYHSHINCKDCLREISDINLESSMIYEPGSLYDLIEKWIPDVESSWIEQPLRTYDTVDPTTFDYKILNYHIGCATGFAFLELNQKGSDEDGNSRLFANSIANKVVPHEYLTGIVQGIINCSTLNSLSRQSLNTLQDPFTSIGGNVITGINNLVNNSQFLALCKHEQIYNYLLSLPHKVPSSYPLSNSDQSTFIKSIMREIAVDRLLERRQKNTLILLFSDILGSDLETSIQLGNDAYNVIISNLSKKQRLNELRLIKNYNLNLRDKTKTKIIYPCKVQVKIISQEIRHVLKFSTFSPKVERPKIVFGKETWGSVTAIQIGCRFNKLASLSMEIPQIANPLISGLRLAQLPTGAHFKLRCLLRHFQITYSWFLCGGDGSGGMTSALLRYNLRSKGIFNSLLNLGDTPMRGTKPSSPSGIDMLGYDRSRCLNVDTCWENQSDLTNRQTWSYFSSWIKERRFDLMVFDMELTSYCKMIKILNNLDCHIEDLLQKNGTIIFKTYLDQVVNHDYNAVSILVSWFEVVYACQTEFTSSNSSEIYVVGLKFQGFKELRYIDPDSIKKVVHNNFVFASFTSEFKRALALRKKDMFAGVHYSLRTSLFTELEILFNTCGVPNGISHRLAADLQHAKIGGIELKWILIQIIDHFCFETDQLVQTPRLPSDQTAKQCLASMIGILYSLSLDYGKDRQGLFTKLIEHGFCVYFNRYQNGELVFQRWGLSYKGKYVNIRSKLALIGSAIRVCERLGERLAVNEVKLNKTWLTANLNNTGVPTLWTQEVWEYSKLDNAVDFVEVYTDYNLQEMSYDID
nr:polymerase [Kolongo virus]